MTLSEQLKQLGMTDHERAYVYSLIKRDRRNQCHQVGSRKDHS